MSEEYSPFVGNIESHQRFLEAFGKFYETIAGIAELTGAIVSDLNTADPDADREVANVIIAELAGLTFEDFDEVVVLCANGFTRGAQKTLRGMFERSVTLFEVDEHATSAKLFHDYTYIDRFKLATQLQQEYPGVFFTEERFAEIKAARDAVQSNYMRACPKCGHASPSNSWMKYGIVELARQRGFRGSLLIHAYCDALHETHPKMQAIFRRLREREDPSQAETGAASLVAAHFLVIENVRVIKERLKRDDLEELYQRCLQEYKDAWPREVRVEESA